MFGFFNKQLAEILAKKAEGYVLTAWDWFVLWMNKMGWTGSGYALVAAIYWIKYIGNGIDMNILIAGICTAIFVQKNLEFFANKWKGAWHKFFPEDLIVPLINRKIK